MDKNTLNFLMYDQKKLTTNEIFSSVFSTGVFLWIEAVIGFQKLMISIWGIAYLIAILLMGIMAKHKQQMVNTYLYRGVVYTGYSIICFMISYGGLRLSGMTNGMTLAAYIFVYFLCFVVTFYMVRHLIKKDAYNKKAQSVSTGSIFIGVILSMLLSPIIFSGYNNNQVGTMIALIFLIVGAACLLGGINLYKAFLFKKYEKEFVS